MSEQIVTDFIDAHRRMVEAKLASEAVCATHLGVPSTVEEEELEEDGQDPCQVVIRLYQDSWPADAPPPQQAHSWGSITRP